MENQTESDHVGVQIGGGERGGADPARHCPADRRLPQNERPHRQAKASARPTDLTSPHLRPVAPAKRQTRHHLAELGGKAELAHRAGHRIIVSDPAVEAGDTADSLQSAPRQERHAT